MTNPTFINKLNEDLKLEYAAAIQYIQHAAMLTGVHFAFVDELLSHADDEIRHAKKLNDHIRFLGGVPIVSVGPVYTSNQAASMLSQDLSGEETAVVRYKERINEAMAEGLFGTVAVLLGILKDEEEHLNDIRSIIE